MSVAESTTATVQSAKNANRAVIEPRGTSIRHPADAMSAAAATISCYRSNTKNIFGAATMAVGRSVAKR